MHDKRWNFRKGNKKVRIFYVKTSESKSAYRVDHEIGVGGRKYVPGEVELITSIANIMNSPDSLGETNSLYEASFEDRTWLMDSDYKKAIKSIINLRNSIIK